MKYMPLLAIVFLHIPSCKDAVTHDFVPNLGIFTYTAYDSVGRTLVRGTLILHNDGSRVTGR